jgi:hypothetical protein
VRCPETGVNARWEDLGFQSDTPSRDFRGMGLLGLELLLHFSQVILLRFPFY